MVLRRKFSAKHYFSDCRRHNVTVAQYIGELCRYLLALPEVNFIYPRYILCHPQN